MPDASGKFKGISVGRVPWHEQQAQAFPEGEEWRCSQCDYTCGDAGPLECPNDGHVLTRVLMRFKLDPHRG